MKTSKNDKLTTEGDGIDMYVSTVAVEVNNSFFDKMSPLIQNEASFGKLEY